MLKGSRGSRKSSLTVVIGGVHQVGVVFSQVSQQWAERGVVSGQRCQVDGIPAIFVQQAGVGARPQQRLHRLHLPGDHGQVERSLQRRQEVMQW